MEVDTVRHGWQSGPDFRGTYDIVKTCLGTVVLLCWSSVCPNVPSQKKGLWHKFSGKIQLFFLSMLGPDFIFATALGQLNEAWRAKKILHKQGYTEWTLRHCFFVNMGGIHLEFRDRKQNGLPTFPADVDQLLYLVRNNYMSLPTITQADIDDRNKADSFTRAIAIIQTTWFTVNIFGRIAQDLFVTTMELTTLSFVFLMTCCSICWWHKPMDIPRPFIVPVYADLSGILAQEHTSAKSFGLTPLSFINRKEWLASQFWACCIHVLRKIIFKSSTITKPTEADHFPSISFHEPDLKWELTAGWVVPAYSAMFMIAWNFPFPTATECLLWRISAIITLAVLTLLPILAFWQQHRVSVASWFGFKKASEAENTIHGNDYGDIVELGFPQPNQHMGLLDRLRNMSANKDPLLVIRIRVWIPFAAMAALYCIARLYILIEDIAGLRSLPQSTFQTVTWNQYWSLF
ncbi:unnamed protein product [Periconia digitata]|uniref:Uncharacterized protein n=1 Tax=Periconia digitata TaxID=1303443 RepID=A0A9W4XWB8_9PLEO|nr:unnamed protein product [Periconia digitata]